MFNDYVKLSDFVVHPTRKYTPKHILYIYDFKILRRFNAENVCKKYLSMFCVLLCNNRVLNALVLVQIWNGNNFAFQVSKMAIHYMCPLSWPGLKQYHFAPTILWSKLFSWLPDTHYRIYKRFPHGFALCM